MPDTLALRKRKAKAKTSTLQLKDQLGSEIDPLSGRFGRASGEQIPIGPSPATEIGRGLLGGVRDFGQQFLDLPASVANVITELASPDPPGGPRRRLIPEIQALQLPDPTGQPQSNLERTVRRFTPLGLDVAALLLPIGKSMLARRAARRTPMLFEEGSVAKGMAIPRGKRTDLRLEPSSPAARPASRFDKPVPTRGEITGILKTPPSEGARGLHRCSTSRLTKIPRMSLKEAQMAYRRIISRVPDHPIHEVENTPLWELLVWLEQHVLSFR